MYKWVLLIYMIWVARTFQTLTEANVWEGIIKNKPIPHGKRNASAWCFVKAQWTANLKSFGEDREAFLLICFMWQSSIRQYEENVFNIVLSWQHPFKYKRKWTMEGDETEFFTQEAPIALRRLNLRILLSSALTLLPAGCVCVFPSTPSRCATYP